MTTLQLSLEIGAPIWRVYQQWRRFAKVSKRIAAISSTEDRGIGRLAWTEEYNGKSYEVAYRVTARPAENVIIWSSETETQDSCTARCVPRSAGKTLVTLKIEYLPDAGWQHPNVVFKRHTKYLNALKDALEAERSSATESFAKASP